MKIVLLGYMGSGKSTIGSCLAKKLSYDFTDLDHYIENKEGKSIQEIFEVKGEIYFRKIEYLYLTQFLNENDSYVLSLGGGTPCYGSNMKLIIDQPNLYSFYLQTSIPTLVERLSKNTSKRPLISSLSKQELTEYVGKHIFERNNFYHKAMYTISTDVKDIETIVTEIRIMLH